MPKSSTAMKATITRRTPTTPVPSDMAERLAQLQHHQAAEALEVATPESEPAQARESEPEPSGKQLKREANALQSAFLTANLNRSVTVFLVNGIKLIGRLRQYDPFTVMLEGPDGVSSLTFKHTISTIQPANRT